MTRGVRGGARARARARKDCAAEGAARRADAAAAPPSSHPELSPALHPSHTFWQGACPVPVSHTSRPAANWCSHQPVERLALKS